MRRDSSLYDPDALSATRRGGARSDASKRRGRGRRGSRATGAAIERASETRTPQGVVAAVALADVAADKVRARRRGRSRPLLLVLDASPIPATWARCCASALAADVDEVLLAPGCADPFAPKVVRAGSGAHFHLPIRAGLAWGEISRQRRGAPPVEQIILAEAGARARMIR